MDGPDELLQDIVETTKEDKIIQDIVETIKVKDKVKQSILETIKANYPKLDPSGVELLYEQHNKAFEDHLKHMEELNKKIQENI